jgi:putative transposase
MTITKSFHCAYDTHYHLVFPVKYRKALLNEEIATAVKALAHEISLRYELTIEQLGTDGDHIHLLVSFHPKYSIGQFVRIFKSNVARELFRQFPSLKKELWGGEFWTDGYYAATVSTAGNWATVEAYVRNQGKAKPTQAQAQLTIW